MCDLELSDLDLTEKFKRQYNEQFHILVRMHLSFLLDQNTDENEGPHDKNKLKKWALVPFNKKTKSRGPMEGAPLTQEGICQVYQLIEFLKKEQNIKIEGIFRRTGSLVRQQELRNLLNKGVTVDLDGSNYSVHDCASVLKGFLADLSDPLLTEAHYPAYCQISDLVQDEQKLLATIQLLFLLLPTENKVLLKDIFELLHLTSSFETCNRMSADNLATLFTPHLLCPRKLSPEQLHVNSQTLSKIISFMILKEKDLFKVPQNLILDFKARYEKDRLNESINDVASTVFTFVDHERTAKENETNTTETALAQLYAHIQSLPESSKKRKLVKQFNKENGHGTPLQVIRSGIPKNKSLGDSIKKHIFQKSVVKKKGTVLKDVIHTPNQLSRAKLFCTNCDASDDEPDPKRQRTSPSPLTSAMSAVTSTPACVTITFTPEDRKSMSPITRSTQRMTRAMQETMMTPRSRKPVLLISGTNINKLVTKSDSVMDELKEEKEDSSLSETFQEYLESRIADSSFSSRTDDFKSLSPSKMSDSLLHCLNGNDPDEKELVLKPKQFDENGHPTVFETSF